MTDALVEHLTAPADTSTRSKLAPIPFGELAPKVVRINRNRTGPLPLADYLVVTYTAAEHQAMADVLSPGLAEADWNYYAHLFNEYEPDLTWRSPAKEVRRLGEYALVTIGTKRVLLFHCQLHLATDSVAMPIRKLFAQIIQETACSVFIDTGTAGGIGPHVVEGDTVVATNLVFDCTGQFKSESWAHESFSTTVPLPAEWSKAEALMATNAALLRPEATRDPVVWVADVITCDSFLFDDVEDSFGLETYDKGRALVEEMDAATLGLVAQDLRSAMPKFTSLRSVSDPQMPQGPSVATEKRDASKIYLKFGYAAQVATLCAVWQLITESN